MSQSNAALREGASSVSPAEARKELIELIVKRIHEKHKANTCFPPIPNLSSLTVQMLRETPTTGNVFELLWEGLNRFEGKTNDTLGSIMDSSLALTRANIESLACHREGETVTGGKLAARLQSLI